ncbi:NAC domain-containing protein 8 [Rhynchospora pubera]|uniref:NAC domain-containing protein 8 n=1 Tax=Rhynchospora pubera TaxID=906938 RepID=A0AAV8CPM4_9POAL|nr:NAC domain-containing protein 8 [Rhynchospora pubera]
MARAWLVNSRGFARKIKNAGPSSSKQINELTAEAKRECPNCYHVIDNSDVGVEWPGLPVGVKFDPSDLELIEHLESKVNSKPHMFIDEFIPTVKQEQGICYTHPENLPGVKKDGTCAHFFYKISNAYASGPRKRRKITTEDCNSISIGHVRWHKTGKSKPIFDNGRQKGWKKIMVLYKSAQRGCKPDKANWVMHQYHLGTEEEEKDGQMVVSKIFYQLGKRREKFELESVEDEDGDTVVHPATMGPKTPMTNAPQPPRRKKSNQVEKAVQNVELTDGLDMQHQQRPASQAVFPKNEESFNWWEKESQAFQGPDPNKPDQSLLCHEVLDSFPPELSLGFGLEGMLDGSYGLSDLQSENLSLHPDLQISEVPFGSQESISSWWQNHD